MLSLALSFALGCLAHCASHRQAAVTRGVLEHGRAATYFAGVAVVHVASRPSLVERAARPFDREGMREPRLFANAPAYKRWLNIDIRYAAKMAAFLVSGARPTGAVTRDA